MHLSRSNSAESVTTGHRCQNVSHQIAAHRLAMPLKIS